MLKLENLTWEAPGGGPVLRGIDLTVPDGKLTVITGPNGGGKTTIAKLVAGLAGSCWMGRISPPWISPAGPGWGSAMRSSSRCGLRGLPSGIFWSWPGAVLFRRISFVRS